MLKLSYLCTMHLSLDGYTYIDGYTVMCIQTIQEGAQHTALGNFSAQSEDGVLAPSLTF